MTALAYLRSIEHWQPYGYSGFKVCRGCGRYFLDGHASDCPLAAAIRDAEQMDMLVKMGYDAAMMILEFPGSEDAVKLARDIVQRVERAK